MDTELTQSKNDKQAAIWSLSDLKKLEPDQIMDRIEQIDNQAMLYKWRLYWALRQKMPSNIEFGNYLDALRNRPHAPQIESQPVINRYIHAGRFCEQHKIGSLEQAGVKPSVIYLLSQPKNKDIADAIFTQIRRKHILHKDVQVMLDRARAVATIEHQPEPEQPKFIEGEVIKSADLGGKVGIYQPNANLQNPAVAPNSAVAEQAVSRLMQSIIEEEQPLPVVCRRRELLLELSQMDNSGVSDDEIQEDYELLDRSYRRNDLKLSEAHNNKRNEYSRRIYGK